MVGVTELVESYSTIAQHEWDPVWTLVVPYLESDSNDRLPYLGSVL